MRGSTWNLPQIFCAKSIIKSRTNYRFATGYNIPIISQDSQQYINYRFKKNPLVHFAEHVLILVNKPTYRYIIFLWASFLQAGKKN